MKRTAASAAVSGLLLAMLAAPAHTLAGTYLGQNNSAATTYCQENRVHAQESITGGLPFVASTPGVITYWSTPATPEPGHTLQLVVLSRNYPPSGVGHFFTAVAKDVVRAQSATGLNEYSGMSVPIEAGEELGLYVPPGQPVVTFMGVTAPAGVCLFGAGGPMNRYRTRAGDPPLGTELDYTSSGANYRLNVQVYVEPDADRDGFGDESQDRCRTDASTQGVCPALARSPAVTPPSPVPRKAKKKCSRKKKGGKGAMVAKKKRCKKKSRPKK